MKKFIAVIGVAGSGKTTFINKNFPSLPVEELNDDTCEDLLLFHPLITFDKAVLHITGFEDVVGDILFDKILKNNDILDIFYLRLKDNEMQKCRLRERAKKNKETEEYDVAPYAYSKNVFERTESSVNNFIEKYRENIASINIINNY